MADDTDRPWSVHPLAASHDRRGFDSGDDALDEFLRRYAGQNERHGISRTFVAVLPDAPTVIGYYTLRMGEVSLEQMPEEERRRLPRYPVPVAHLARLAVDRRHRGPGLGEYLLMNALERALTLTDSIGVYAVEVFAKTEAAREFYLRYGFHALVDDRLHLYLSMKAIAKAFHP